jgi:hypothetical protein
VRWLTSRSDSTIGRGQAAERRLAFAPSCDTGRCDIAVKPDGMNGTYLPEWYTAVADAKPPTPYTLTWTEATGTYEFVDQRSLVSCTTVDGTVVPNGYEITSTTSVRFVAGAAGRPPALRGTYTEKSTGVGAGIAAKCTDYETSWTIAAAPTSVAPNDQVDLAGTYVTTEVVESVLPAGTRAPGYAGILLPSAKVEKAGSGYAISGTAPKPVDLSFSASGWAGAATSSTTCGTETRSVPDGYDQTERWSRLRPVGSTEDDRPIIVGHWESDWAPTPAGAAADCAAAGNRGYVILIPAESVPTA